VRLGGGLFCAYLVIFALCFAYPVYYIATSLRVAYLESAEEPLVDMANVLAAFVGGSNPDGVLDPERLQEIFSEASQRQVSARIYATLKDRVDVRVYITDAAGIVVFDSASPATVGEDYSQWRDVRLTLAGSYGARVQNDPDRPDSPLVLFVAAPVYIDGRIAGALTVAKPTTSINAFLQSARPRFFRVLGLSAGAAVVLGLAVSLWLGQQVRRLTRYADDVRGGLRVPFPSLARTELLTMGVAFDKMRETLAGQAYIERYVQALTHELKSPISAIRGAAEILEDTALSAENRARFLHNVQHETHRIQDLVDRMLKLSALEARSALSDIQIVPLAPIVRGILESLETIAAHKKLRVESSVADDVSVRGDPFLLHLALSNLVQNAVDFSSEGGAIRISSRREGNVLELSIQDEGPGIPAYATSRIFEKFFSLPRPDTGKKSTGLGLNFVQEVASLHQGSVRVENLAHGGLLACLSLPA
jgi:two-component system, OmpR family, sensor histidine kinase CreC